jgi:soluble lytic murein transglycosylase-like protein
VLARISSLLLFFYLFLPINAISDPEIVESSKCSKLFPVFENKFSIPTNTLHSIALKESGKKHKEHKIRVVWPWTVNVGGKGYYFNTKREAILFVKKQIIKGKENIDVGCMQINLKHHLEGFNSLEQAFDPYRNVKYGAMFLRSKYEQLGSWHKAIAHYHSATHALGSKYRQDVVKIANNMALYKASLSNFIDKNNVIEETSNIPNETRHSKRGKRTFFSNNKRYKSNIMVTIPVKN